MSRIAEQIRGAVNGRHPLIYLQTTEEARTVDAIRQIAAERFKTGEVSIWTCVTGVDLVEDCDTSDPVDAIKEIMAHSHEGFLVMKDLSDFIERPEVVRALRNAYLQFGQEAKTSIIIISPRVVIPDALEKEVCLVELELPMPEELLARTLEVEAEYPGLAIPEELHSEIALALRGLTLGEVGHVMYRVFGSGNLEERDILNEIFEEKRLLMKKTGFLEFIPNRIDIDGIGGLSVLKSWTMKRKDLFTHDAVKAGLPTPKGILIMGVSGCGKSMCSKAIASLWNVPLFRLDMNLVFSGLYGTAEAAFHRALKSVEAVAPAVLWIDEIENALGMTTESATVEQSLTFSSFLTWMQERPPLVFVTATANRIQSLPAEVIRKGRFDEVFFCDLPDEDERREILNIHLRGNGAEEGEIDVERLLLSTEAWTGAEIEQAIVSARIDAKDEDRRMTLDDIRRQIVQMVPLSRTMSEQIKEIRSWAFSRATSASKAKAIY